MSREDKHFAVLISFMLAALLIAAGIHTGNGWIVMCTVLIAHVSLLTIAKWLRHK